MAGKVSYGRIAEELRRALIGAREVDREMAVMDEKFIMWLVSISAGVLALVGTYLSDDHILGGRTQLGCVLLVSCMVLGVMQRVAARIASRLSMLVHLERDTVLTAYETAEADFEGGLDLNAQLEIIKELAVTLSTRKKSDNEKQKDKSNKASIEESIGRKVRLQMIFAWLSSAFMFLGCATFVGGVVAVASGLIRTKV